MAENELERFAVKKATKLFTQHLKNHEKTLPATIGAMLAHMVNVDAQLIDSEVEVFEKLKKHKKRFQEIYDNCATVKDAKNMVLKQLNNQKFCDFLENGFGTRTSVLKTFSSSYEKATHKIDPKTMPGFQKIDIVASLIRNRVRIITALWNCVVLSFTEESKRVLLLGRDVQRFVLNPIIQFTGSYYWNFNALIGQQNAQVLEKPAAAPKTASRRAETQQPFYDLEHHVEKTMYESVTKLIAVTAKPEKHGYSGLERNCLAALPDFGVFLMGNFAPTLIKLVSCHLNRVAMLTKELASAFSRDILNELLTRIGLNSAFESSRFEIFATLNLFDSNGVREQSFKHALICLARASAVIAIDQKTRWPTASDIEQLKKKQTVADVLNLVIDNNLKLNSEIIILFAFGRLKEAVDLIEVKDDVFLKGELTKMSKNTSKSIQTKLRKIEKEYAGDGLVEKNNQRVYVESFNLLKTKKKNQEKESTKASTYNYNKQHVLKLISAKDEDVLNISPFTRCCRFFKAIFDVVAALGGQMPCYVTPTYKIKGSSDKPDIDDNRLNLLNFHLLFLAEQQKLNLDISIVGADRAISFAKKCKPICIAPLSTSATACIPLFVESVFSFGVRTKVKISNTTRFESLTGLLPFSYTFLADEERPTISNVFLMNSSFMYNSSVALFSGHTLRKGIGLVDCVARAFVCFGRNSFVPATNKLMPSFARVIGQNKRADIDVAVEPSQPTAELVEEWKTKAESTFSQLSAIVESDQSQLVAVDIGETTCAFGAVTLDSDYFSKFARKKDDAFVRLVKQNSDNNIESAILKQNNCFVIKDARYFLRNVNEAELEQSKKKTSTSVEQLECGVNDKLRFNYHNSNVREQQIEQQLEFTVHQRSDSGSNIGSLEQSFLEQHDYFPNHASSLFPDRPEAVDKIRSCLKNGLSVDRDHRYWLNGIQLSLPTVTQVVSKLTDIEYDQLSLKTLEKLIAQHDVNIEKRNEAREFGCAVDKSVTAIVDGGTVQVGDDSVGKCASGFVKLLERSKALGYGVLASQQALYSENIVGTADMIFYRVKNKHLGYVGPSRKADQTTIPTVSKPSTNQDVIDALSSIRDGAHEEALIELHVVEIKAIVGGIKQDSLFFHRRVEEFDVARGAVGQYELQAALYAALLAKTVSTVGGVEVSACVWNLVDEDKFAVIPVRKSVIEKAKLRIERPFSHDEPKSDVERLAFLKELKLSKQVPSPMEEDKKEIDENKEKELRMDILELSKHLEKNADTNVAGRAALAQFAVAGVAPTIGVQQLSSSQSNRVVRAVATDPSPKPNADSVALWRVAAQVLDKRCGVSLSFIDVCEFPVRRALKSALKKRRKLTSTRAKRSRRSGPTARAKRRRANETRKEEDNDDDSANDDHDDDHDHDDEDDDDDEDSDDEDSDDTGDDEDEDDEDEDEASYDTGDDDDESAQSKDILLEIAPLLRHILKHERSNAFRKSNGAFADGVVLWGDVAQTVVASGASGPSKTTYFGQLDLTGVGGSSSQSTAACPHASALLRQSKSIRCVAKAVDTVVRSALITLEDYGELISKLPSLDEIVLMLPDRFRLSEHIPSSMSFNQVLCRAPPKNTIGRVTYFSQLIAYEDARFTHQTHVDFQRECQFGLHDLLTFHQPQNFQVNNALFDKESGVSAKVADEIAANAVNNADQVGIGKTPVRTERIKRKKGWNGNRYNYIDSQLAMVGYHAACKRYNTKTPTTKQCLKVITVVAGFDYVRSYRHCRTKGLIKHLRKTLTDFDSGSHSCRFLQESEINTTSTPIHNEIKNHFSTVHNQSYSSKIIPLTPDTTLFKSTKQKKLPSKSANYVVLQRDVASAICQATLLRRKCQKQARAPQYLHSWQRNARRLWSAGKKDEVASRYGTKPRRHLMDAIMFVDSKAS